MTYLQTTYRDELIRRGYYDLTEMDEQDIQNELQKMIDSMDNTTGFALDTVKQVLH
ncbi:hypothetical protein [Virgibacillus ndiopensis]|uniref:hypothetical protein n=1 Tax=Virgibacillus ndiopensis TaxID=2004408 RepID=UPI00159BA82D|nr:hypothetical protein [Virgibacillus ndiopensis]